MMFYTLGAAVYPDVGRFGAMTCACVDDVKPGDRIACYNTVEVKRTLG